MAPRAIRKSRADPQANKITFASNIDELREHLKTRQKLLEDEEETGNDQDDIETGEFAENEEGGGSDDDDCSDDDDDDGDEGLVIEGTDFTAVGLSKQLENFYKS